MNIISTILGYILGLIGIYFTIKYYTRKKITYINPIWISYNDLDNNTIHFTDKTKEESKNLFIYCTSILNTGNKDFDKLNIFSPLTISFSNEYKIVNSKIISKSDDLNIIIKQDENQIQFDWELFKVNEYFRLVCVIECVSKITDIPETKFNHRIADLNDIKEYEISFRQNKWITIFLICFCFLTGVQIFNLLWGSNVIEKNDLKSILSIVFISFTSGSFIFGSFYILYKYLKENKLLKNKNI